MGEMKNITALNSFRDSLTSKKEYGSNGYRFIGLVSYYASQNVVTENLDVFIIFGGYEPCIKLDIFEEGEIITGKGYHFEFYPKYKNIIFTFNQQSQSLSIEGESSSFGNYKVVIIEN